MKCIRNCGRKAAATSRLYAVCTDRQRKRNRDRGSNHSRRRSLGKRLEANAGEVTMAKRTTRNTLEKETARKLKAQRKRERKEQRRKEKQEQRP
jgi:hypothetical protein